MAGVGLLLRRLNPYNSFLGWGRTYGTAALISSGPWLVSILGILLVGFLTLDRVNDPDQVTAFQVSVTYLFSFSLIYTGPFQLLFTRYAADRIFEKRQDALVPALLGVLLLATILAGAAASLFAFFALGETSLIYQVLMVVGFTSMCDLWILVVLLTGLKAYRLVVTSFAGAYGVVLGGAVVLGHHGLEGLLFAFVLGQVLLTFALLAAVLRDYARTEDHSMPESFRLVRFEFLNRRLVFFDLAWTGVFYSLAIWVDKMAFWLHPSTGHQVIGPLRASVVYDLPIFLAYLTIVPGMAVFLVRVETDFAEVYDEFFGMVREGSPLLTIEETRDRMIETVRGGLYDIVKIQGITLALVLLFAPELLELFGISRHYKDLFGVDAIGVSAQLLFLAVLNVLFYLDHRRTALSICVGFAALNLVFTLATLELGPDYYGLGFTLAAIVMVVVGLFSLSRRLEHLVRENFMLKSVSR